MTGPEHYRQGELLLAEAFKDRDYPVTALVAAAQAHFTAALAAATALGHREVPAGDDDSYSTSNLPYDDYNAWWKAASEGPAARQRREESARTEREEFLSEMRGVRRGTNTGPGSTAEWFHDAKEAGCTATSYDSDMDAILHEDAPPCPVHEPGDVVPVEELNCTGCGPGTDHDTHGCPF